MSIWTDKGALGTRPPKVEFASNCEVDGQADETCGRREEKERRVPLVRVIGQTFVEVTKHRSVLSVTRTARSAIESAAPWDGGGEHVGWVGCDPA